MPDIEEKKFTPDELRSGIQLTLGRPVVVIIDGPPTDTPSVLGTLDAAHFEKAKAFPLPPAIGTFRAAAARIAAEPSRALLIAGHTDTKGQHDDYNLQLAQERAAAISAYLRNAADEWMPFYSNSDPQKLWGTREDQHMLSALPFGGAPFYTGNIDGNPGPKTADALQRFQAEHGLPAGEANQATRRALVLEYMQAEGTTVPGSASIRALGCGVRHLEEKTGPDVDNAQNRRVDLFLFAGKIVPAPEECENGAHPGCTVYDRWKKAVTGPLDAAPSATQVTSFGFAGGGEKLGIVGDAKTEVFISADAEEGVDFQLSWHIEGPFKAVSLNKVGGKAQNVLKETDPAGTGSVFRAPDTAPNGEHTETFTIEVTDPGGKKVTRGPVSVRVHRTNWLPKELKTTTFDTVPIYGIDISQNRFTNPLNDPTTLLAKGKVRGHKIEFIIVEATVGTSEVAADILDKDKKPTGKKIEFFKDNWAALEARTDVIRGAYHFFTNAEPVAQAKAYVKTITSRSTKALKGAFRPFLDLELPVKPANAAAAQALIDEAKKKGISLEFAGPNYLKNAKIWIDEVKKAPPDGLGLEPIIYAVPGPWNAYPAADRAVIAGLKLKLWIAVPGFNRDPPIEPKQFIGKAPGSDFPKGDFPDWDLWQFEGSDTNKDDFEGLGAKKNVDLNVINGGSNKLKLLLVP